MKLLDTDMCIGLLKGDDAVSICSARIIIS